MNVFLTGASGFIGSHVAEVLGRHGHAIGQPADVAMSTLTGPVNIGSGQPVTVREMATKIAGIIGRPDLVQLGAYQASPTDSPYVVADITKVRTVWRPRISLDDGLRATIEWWRQA